MGVVKGMSKFGKQNGVPVGTLLCCKFQSEGLLFAARRCNYCCKVISSPCSSRDLHLHQPVLLWDLADMAIRKLACWFLLVARALD